MKFKTIGRGVYSLSQAARLSGVPRQRIRRWVRGQTYRHLGEERHTPPIIATGTEPMEGATVLDFADLLEVKFLNAFREYGVSWKAIRIAAESAKELLGRHHPFSTRIFKTDGRTILAEIVKETGDKILLDMVNNQYAFPEILSPLLYSGLEFNELAEPERWWPLGKDRTVLIDPTRGFGAPLCSHSGVPTRILANGVAAEDSIDFVARWYEVREIEVKDAVEFETRLAA